MFESMCFARLKGSFTNMHQRARSALRAISVPAIVSLGGTGHHIAQPQSLSSLTGYVQTGHVRSMSPIEMDECPR